MPILPSQHPLNERLNDVIASDLPRPYLGMSMLGEKCTRYMQYYFRWAYKEEVSARLRRLFDMGHDTEARVLAALGVEESQTPMEYRHHVKGHCDGLMGDAVLELKTHNDANFKKLHKSGVRSAFPKHYSQMQMYMWGMKLRKCTYIAINKNDSSTYIVDVDYDEAHVESLLARADKIIEADKLFPKIGSGKATWHECKWCNAKQVCHYGAELERNCRTCANVVMNEKSWECGWTNKEMSVDMQKAGCDQYELNSYYFEV